jgi:hypothetical protein
MRRASLSSDEDDGPKCLAVAIRNASLVQGACDKAPQADLVPSLQLIKSDCANSFPEFSKINADEKIAQYTGRPIPEFYWAKPYISDIQKSTPAKFLLDFIRIQRRQGG